MPNSRNSGAASRCWLAAVALAGLLPACGARALVDGTPEDDEEFDTSGAGGGRGGSGGRGGGTGGVDAAPTIDPGGPIDPDGVPLPNCAPGFSMATAGSRECAYLYQGKCHEQRLAACACACEGLANAQCIIGGFLNPDEPQSVSCIQR
jgi:hypothetical protein